MFTMVVVVVRKKHKNMEIILSFMKRITVTPSLKKINNKIIIIIIIIIMIIIIIIIIMIITLILIIILKKNFKD